ncbi:MAG: HD-GYP domain-containing protein, partial [Halanaerobiales bacterium]
HKLETYSKEIKDIQERFARELISSILNIVDIYDEYTSGHSENVAELSSAIAEKLNCSREVIKNTYWAGMVHDIGKLLIPLDILNKESTLTEKEFEKIKKHPEWGYQALNKTGSFEKIAEYILYHHERWDGGGYPRGLKGKEIPLVSRILALADAWDAMRSRRAYRDPLSETQAIQEIRDNTGSQFDPEIASVFLQYQDLR